MDWTSTRDSAIMRSRFDSNKGGRGNGTVADIHNVKWVERAWN
jgi:hypothetical protein